MKRFEVIPIPRISMTWEEFISKTPPNSIALDGVVLGPPAIDDRTNHINFDHHVGVVRDATMSTCMQLYFAIKGGLMKRFKESDVLRIYINDTDQDTCLAVWLLLHYKEFEGAKSIPHVNRLLALNDRWDITGGAFPMNLNEALIRQHCWIFEPYSKLRKTGGLALADETILRNNLEAVLARLDKYLMGESGEVELDTRHEIFYDCPHFKIINEIGGNEARYFLFNQGMDAFISLVTMRPDGNGVWSIGRRSQHIRFPVKLLYEDFNQAEGLEAKRGWGGSDIVGGSSRTLGSSLSWEDLKDITLTRLRIEGIV